MGCGRYPCICYAPNPVPDARPYQGPATTDAAQERIARALERIADALEGKP